jgi:hypothetical protein
VHFGEERSNYGRGNILFLGEEDQILRGKQTKNTIENGAKCTEIMITE